MNKVLFTSLIVLSGFVFCAKQETIRLEREKSLANILMEKELYPQAVELYEKLLRSGRLNLKEEAGIADRMASIYLEKLNDPENALVCLLRVRELAPGSDLAKDAEKRIIECLERTGRYADARYEASRATALTAPSGTAADPVLAQIEGRTFTRSQVERMTGPLRGSRQQNQAAVRNALAYELLAQSAVRKGLDRKSDFSAKLEGVRRSLLAEAALSEQMAGVSVDTSMADEYFSAHKERYADSTAAGKPRIPEFSAVRSMVIADMLNEKKQQTAARLMQDLLRTADVKIFDDRIP